MLKLLDPTRPNTAIPKKFYTRCSISNTGDPFSRAGRMPQRVCFDRKAASDERRLVAVASNLSLFSSRPAAIFWASCNSIWEASVLFNTCPKKVRKTHENTIMRWHDKHKMAALGPLILSQGKEVHLLDICHFCQRESYV